MQVIPLTKDWELHRDENDNTLYLAHISDEVNTILEIGTCTIPIQLTLEEAVNLLRSNGLTTSKPN